jgi:Endonuclease I
VQPPEASRGEIARALLYMELRYGTRTTASDGLGLALTDCPPNSNETTTNQTWEHNNPYVAKMGYLSQLVQWHLEYPPTAAERGRNDKVCMQYQGNRNPFVDFPQDSWGLLNLQEEEACPPPEIPSPVISNGTLNDGGESIGQGGEVNSTAGADGREDDEPPPSSDVTAACQGLLPGDINFYLVESGMVSADGTEKDAFGIVTLVDLPAGLGLFATDNAWIGNDRGFQTTEGTFKVNNVTRPTPVRMLCLRLDLQSTPSSNNVTSICPRFNPPWHRSLLSQRVAFPAECTSGMEMTCTWETLGRKWRRETSLPFLCMMGLGAWETRFFCIAHGRTHPQLERPK